MGDVELLDYLGADGAKWAAEFRKTAIKLGYSDMDEGWLIGWFANAIEAGGRREDMRAENERLTTQVVRDDEHYTAAMAMNEKHRKLWVEECQKNALLRAALADQGKGTDVRS